VRRQDHKVWRGSSFAVGGRHRLGLHPFRLVIGLMSVCMAVPASTALAAKVCSNEGTRIGPSASLPDCRAYELVTPADRSEAVQDLHVSNTSAIVASDGESMALESLVALGPTPVTNGSLSMFKRTPSGWQLESVPSLDTGGVDYEGPIFSADLTQVGVAIESSEGSPGETFEFGAPGELSTTVAVVPNSRLEGYFAGATPDFSHIFLASTDHALLSSTPTGTVEGAHDLYEWSNGRLKLVNVTSGGSLINKCGAKFEDVSEDGSRVIFVSPDPEATSGDPSCQEPQRLYMRVTNAVAGKEESRILEISEPNEGVLQHAGVHRIYPGAFGGVGVYASGDGSRVFFTTETELTKDDEGVGGEQLYEYNTNAPEKERLTRISRGALGTTRAGGVYISRDGSKVYFRAEREEGGFYIYRYNAGASERLHLVSVAATPEEGNPEGEENNEITANGNFFVFVGRSSAGGDEIYRYDDEDGSVTCISCRQDGAPADGEAGFLDVTDTKGRFSAPTPHFRMISEDGSYVFFESTESLVPQAVNVSGGTLVGGNTDVYEWHNGVVSLISSGNSTLGSSLLGASASGSDVFFLTHAPLVSQDTTSDANIYDARINGGFPAPAEPTACLGDTCLSVPVAPNDPTPALSSFSGPGDLVSPITTATSKTAPKAKKCVKGKVRKKGRCVKQPTAKRRAKKAARLPAKRDHRGSR